MRLELGLENAFVQELESQEHYLPDFDAGETPYLDPDLQRACLRNAAPAVRRRP